MRQAPEVVLRIAQTIACTEAEGPGRRFALWFQGCPLRCPGCCNPEMLPFEGGRRVALADVLRDIETAAAQDGVEGVTLLGGEPLAHAAGAAALARAVRERGLTVMVFSGYTLEEARALPDPAVAIRPATRHNPRTASDGNKKGGLRFRGGGGTGADCGAVAIPSGCPVTRPGLLERGRFHSPAADFAGNPLTVSSRPVRRISSVLDSCQRGSSAR